MGELKSEGRNPKAEIRKPVSGGRSFRLGGNALLANAPLVRSSGFGLLSAFGFRPSDFGADLTLPRSPSPPVLCDPARRGASAALARGESPADDTLGGAGRPGECPPGISAPADGPFRV